MQVKIAAAAEVIRCCGKSNVHRTPNTRKWYQSARNALHDLILGQARSLGLHSISTTAGCLILDEAQAKWAATILVTGEFFDGSLCVFCSVEANNTSAPGSAVRLVLNFGLLDLSDGGEELDQILVACGPRKLLMHQRNVQSSVLRRMLTLRT